MVDPVTHVKPAKLSTGGSYHPDGCQIIRHSTHRIALLHFLLVLVHAIISPSQDAPPNSTAPIPIADNVFVNVVASVQYRALSHKASDAFYKLSNTRSQIQAYVFDVIRASVPKLNLDDAFEQKNDIAKAVEEELEKAMSAYGYEIVQTLIVDIEPDEHVKRAMNEINAAARLRVAANEKAEAEKIIQIKRAEGEAESKYLSGLGIARQRQAIVDGLRDSVLGFSVNVPGTTAKDVMDMVLVTQYFDTMKEIGAASKSSAVFIPHGPGAVRDVATQIRDGLLQAAAHN
ncbi:hypothetical protein COCNU_06G001310 [Cocos nucifera]|uniref:Band 7 domain-containing protein n=1 Tax=Cocos nucifera TaxID=13894 RepID=A0A8K0IAH4_COCNU|nr:hypothetical protein COCNU_06G001310 [Cocos nucifera]